MIQKCISVKYEPEPQVHFCKVVVPEMKGGPQIKRRSPAGPVDPSFRALSGRLKFTVPRHKFNKDSLCQRGVGHASPFSVHAVAFRVEKSIVCLVKGLGLRDYRIAF